jgi:hypothetical protein
MQATRVLECEQLDQRGNGASTPGPGRNGASVDDDLEAA